MIRVVLRESDNVIEVSDLLDQLTGDFVDTALVEVTLFEPDGSEVAGVIWPIVLSNVTNGDYSGLIPDSADLALNEIYDARIVVDDGPGRRIVEVHTLEIVENTG